MVDFNDYSKKARDVFGSIFEMVKSDKDKNDNKKMVRKNDNFLWERAVLSIGDYLIKASADRKNLLSTTKNIRDYSWKRLLRIDSENLQKRKFVQDVFDKLKNKDNLEVNLKNICKNKTTDWRQYFIKDSRLIKYCKQGFIRHNDEDKKSRILLYNASRHNHKFMDMFLYLAYLKLSDDIKELMPFTNVKPHDTSGGKSNCVVLESENDYSLDIVYEPNKDNYFSGNYVIKSSIRDSNKIEIILESFFAEKNNAKFKDQADRNYWLIEKCEGEEPEKKLVQYLKELCKQLPV